MVNYKAVIFSLILPVGVIIVIPLLIYLLTGSSNHYIALSSNMYYLILGFFLVIIGLYLLVICISIFYKKGKGTLMPLSKMHTQHLVIIGPYKYVRNPMIIGVILTVFGEAFIFESISTFICAIIFFILNLIYIPLIEEKGVLKRFGKEFIQYKREVNGWIPKFKAYDPSKTKKI
jgi:protein-S-isoprenylcysteine O-methyltransferase Ste14